MVDLRGRAVLVTGAGRGLGRAYALDAADAGASVMVNDRDRDVAEAVAAEIAAAGGRAEVSDHSVDDPAAVTAMVDAAVAAFGALDGMVINAGLYHEAMPWEEDPQTVARDIGVNVLGGLYCVAAAARAMVPRRRGAIVIASSAGALGSRRIMTYAASKGALTALTASAALDLAEHGVRVNAIAPVALTRMTGNAIGRNIVAAGRSTALLAELDQRRPEAVAPLVSYLLSDDAAGVTGQFVRFDGQLLAVFPQTSLPDLPGLTAAGWTRDEIAAAFAGPLAGLLQRFGVELMAPDAAAHS